MWKSGSYVKISCFVTEIYSKVAQNSIVQARPAVIHFSGFDLNKVHKVVLRLANVSGDVQRMHIIPPQTKYFYVKYTKNVCISSCSVIYFMRENLVTLLCILSNQFCANNNMRPISTKWVPCYNLKILSNSYHWKQQSISIYMIYSSIWYLYSECLYILIAEEFGGFFSIRLPQYWGDGLQMNMWHSCILDDQFLNFCYCLWLDVVL